MRDRKDKFNDIYAYLFINGHKGFVADNDIISNHVAFQYEIDGIKNKMCQVLKTNRMYLYSLVQSLKKKGYTVNDAINEGLNQLFKNGDFIAKRNRKPAGWSFIFTDDELSDMEKKYGKTNERRLEGSYNIFEVLNIDDKRFEEIAKEKKMKKKKIKDLT